MLNRRDIYVLELFLDGSVIQYEWRLISRRARYSISYAPSCEEQTRSFHSGIIPYRSCGTIKRRFLFKSPRTYEVRPIRGSDKIPPHRTARHRLAGTVTFRESPAHGSLISSSSSSRGFSCDVKTRCAKLRNAVLIHRDIVIFQQQSILNYGRKYFEIQKFDL